MIDMIVCTYMEALVHITIRYKPPPLVYFQKVYKKMEMISPHSHPNFLGYCPKILLEGEKDESMKDSF